MTDAISQPYREETLTAAIYDRTAKINVRIWEPDGYTRTIICVHGYMGNGGDFAVLANSMVGHGFRVVAPDLIGRGKSTYFGNIRYYNLNSYVRCLRTVRNRIVGPEFGMIATSAGGLHALYLCKVDGVNPDKIVLNDVPMVIDERVTEINLKISEEIHQEFKTEEEAIERFMVTRSEMTFGSDKQLTEFARNRMIPFEHGYRYAIDPVIADQRRSAAGRRYEIENMLSQSIDEILFLYGTASKFNDVETALKVRSRIPSVSVRADFHGGHPLSLTCPNEVDAIVELFS